MSDVEEKKKPTKHIRNREDSSKGSTCDAYVRGEEVLDENLVDVARESDCDACRAKLFIAPAKDLSVKGPPVYTPQPMENIESLEEIRRRRDGR